MFEHPEIERYKKRIADLKAGGCGGAPGDGADDAMPIDEIINTMEAANQTIGRATGTEVRSVRGHLEHVMRSGASFDSRRFGHLFSAPADRPAREGDAQKKAKRGLDYSYREKMAGFVMKSRRLEWEEDRIDDFLEAIRRA